MLSRVLLFATPRTVTRQAPLSMEFSRQEYWSGLPFPPPWYLPKSNPGLLDHGWTVHPWATWEGHGLGTSVLKEKSLHLLEPRRAISVVLPLPKMFFHLG